jgi:hypothetical protein
MKEMEMILNINNMIEVFLRVGLVLLISGVFIRLFFGDWTVILILGIILTFPAVIEKGILGIRDNVSQENVGT